MHLFRFLYYTLCSTEVWGFCIIAFALYKVFAKTKFVQTLKKQLK